MATEDTPEQQARDMLARMGIEGAQDWSAGDVVELANLLAEHARLEGERAELLSVVATAHTAGLRFGMGPCVCKWCACAAALEADRG